MKKTSLARVDGAANNANFADMSASNSKSELFQQPITVRASETVHLLCPTSFRIRKNGLEFKTTTEVALWTEMTVDLQLPGTKSFTCGGVVVASRGSRHAGYDVSLVFTSVSDQAQQRLNDFSSIAAISVRA